MPIVYLILQYQESCDYHGYPIYAYHSQEEAEERCRALNEEYGDGDSHYYEITFLNIL